MKTVDKWFSGTIVLALLLAFGLAVEMSAKGKLEAKIKRLEAEKREPFNLRYANLREVTIVYEGDAIDNPQREVHLLAEKDINTFLEASRKLHNDPGVNPHNKGKTSKMDRMLVAEPIEPRPFWWSSPDLGSGTDNRAALIYGFKVPRTLWPPK